MAVSKVQNEPKQKGFREKDNYDAIQSEKHIVALSLGLGSGMSSSKRSRIVRVPVLYMCNL